MNLEQLLNYVTHRSESIIQWMFFAILLLSGYLIARGLFAKKSESSSSAGPSPEMEAALQKILDQTAKLESLSIEKMAPADRASVDAEVQALKVAVQQREAELATLKSGGGGGGGGDGEVGARIKELEAKLAEYEILEDDIADLSLYKEENARLRTEVEKIKGGGGGTAPAAEPSGPPPRATEGEDIVAEFAQAVGQETEPAAPAELELPESGDPMADFESAMQKAAEPDPAPEPVAAPAPAPAAPVAAKPAPAPAAAPVAAAAADPAAQTEADDLFAEFASANPESEPAVEVVASAATAGDGEVTGGSLDTDKMMEEMAALVSMEPAADAALEESIDTDKMAAEASDFQKS